MNLPGARLSVAVALYTMSLTTFCAFLSGSCIPGTIADDPVTTIDEGKVLLYPPMSATAGISSGMVSK